MTWSPQMVERWGERGIDYVHTLFDRDGKLRPMATLLATRDPQTLEAYPRPGGLVLLPSSFCSLSDRQMFSEKITEMARRCGALGVVFAAEAWEARPSPATAESAIAAARAGRLEHYPGRLESLFYSFQRVGSSITRSWRARISRDANGKPSLGAFIEEERESVVLVGLFTNLMPPVN